VLGKSGVVSLKYWALCLRFNGTSSPAI